MPNKPDNSIKPDANALAKGVHEGSITPDNLPMSVYEYNALQLSKAIQAGYKVPKIGIEYNSPDFRMLASLHDNVYIFSGAKTFQQTLAMSQALTDGDRVLPFNEFKEAVEKINDEFNDNYLRAEYDTALDSALSASTEIRLQNEKDTLPYAVYSTIGDACDICEPLDGITLPVDDPFWDDNTPPNHYNCKCLKESTDDESGLTSQSEADDINERIQPLKSDVFNNNPGKTGVIFNSDHPYFNIPKEYAAAAEKNFGLPVPNFKDRG